MSQEFNHDGYMSLLTGAGSRRDPETTAKWLANPVLGPQQLTEMFQSGGVARTVVELPANEMVRPWFTVAGDKGKEVLDVLESIGAQDLVTSAVVWARLYGGSVAVFSLDGGNYSSPVRQFKNLQGGRVFDRNQVTLKLDRLSRDPVRQLNGLPEYIEVSVNRGMGAQDGSTVLVNEERFVYVPGARAPNLLRDQQGWDAPILQHCQDAILRYTMGLTYTSNILRDFVQGVLSVKNLTSMLASGQEEIVQRRLQLLDLSRSILNTMLLDADGEEFNKSTSSVAGLEGILDRYLEQLSMACGIPVTKLAGRSAAGLNATGDGDLANYYDMLAAERKRVVSPLVERLVQLVYRSTGGPTGGTEPENWSIEWNPFFQLTDLQEAELRNKIANTDKIYLDARVLSPAEVANSRFGKGEFSMETEIDESEERSTFADMAEEQMALLEAAKAPKQETGAEGNEERTDASPRTLYVSRRLINAAEVLKWARSQGLKGLEKPEDLHVTIAYSRIPVDWMKMGNSWEGELKLPAGGPRIVEPLGDASAVLLFSSSELTWRNTAMQDAGASWDHPEYQPHVTLSYEAGQDLSSVEPYTGELVFGPEIFEEIDTDRADAADQPRVPAGSPAGGQFASKSSAALASSINSLPDHPTFENSKKNPLDTDNKRWGRDPGSAAIYKFAKENGPFPEKEVKISSISSDQDNVYVPQLMKLAEGAGSGETPIVLDRGEKGYRVIDGNHRIVLEKLKGEEDIKVQVLSVHDKKLEQYLLSVGMDKYELMAIRGDSKS